MDTGLRSFLARHVPVGTESVVWDHLFRFHVATYLSDEFPPLELVTSVRAIVLLDGLVLVQRDRDSLHVLPGGRREAGESLEATPHREVREETGWTLGWVSSLGFMHYHHLGPKPPDHPYPYPDFVQVVYAARATTFSAESKLDDDFEMESSFIPTADLEGLGLSRREVTYLDAALRVTSRFAEMPQRRGQAREGRHA